MGCGGPIPFRTKGNSGYCPKPRRRRMGTSSHLGPTTFAGKLGLGLTQRTTHRDEMQSGGSTFVLRAENVSAGAGLVGAGKVFVDDAPVFTLFGEDVSAAAVDFAATAQLHGPVKGGDGGGGLPGTGLGRIF